MGRTNRAIPHPPSQDDYAFLISGLLDLYEASADVAWLQWALELQRELDTHFWDEDAGGYFNTREGDPAILLRMKAREACSARLLPSPQLGPQRPRRLSSTQEDYDSAEPSASSVAVDNLLRLSGLLGTNCRRLPPCAKAAHRVDPIHLCACGLTASALPLCSPRSGEEADGPFRKRAAACAAAFAGRLRDIPLAMPALCAALASTDPALSTQVVVASSGGGVPGEFLAAALGAALLPARHVVAVDLGSEASREFWRALCRHKRGNRRCLHSLRR